MDWFKTIGINKKQQNLYLYLINHGSSTASQLAKGLDEQRTNIYLLVEELENKGLVERNESRPTAQFLAVSPNRLQQLMSKQQQELSYSSTNLRQDLPELISTFQLTNPRPGFTYFEGLKGYSAILDDMIRSRTEICIFGANDTPTVRQDAWAILQNKLAKRALAKIDTRLLFESGLKQFIDTQSRARQRMEVRFWGESAFEGELAIYEQKVVLTTYDDKLVSFVIKNPIISATMMSIFNTAWQAAKA